MKCLPEPPAERFRSGIHQALYRQLLESDVLQALLLEFTSSVSWTVSREQDLGEAFVEWLRRR